ncbi:hypothetical protein TYRP_005208 [Tyrophagus putrescentiae]|nr:hypothetical protein TYRP_005208 [Tyrophagus putrescentiae]
MVTERELPGRDYLTVVVRDEAMAMARYKEMALEWLVAWRWPQVAMMQMATGWPGDGLEMAPCGPKMAPYGLEIAPNGLEMAPSGLELAPSGP